MNTEAFFKAHGAKADPAHVTAVVSTVSAMLQATAAAFARLPLEAEPSDFDAAQRRHAP